MSTSTLGRLLIVDDEVELKTALCETLSAQGYDVVGAASPTEALQAMEDEGFDLLLADLMMPEMDGVALLRAALAIDPSLVGIIMTGQGTVQTAVEAMKAGAFDYVLKPFRLQTLLVTLSRAIGVRQLRKENLQLRETVALYELSRTIEFTLDLNTILQKIADAALQQCEADEISIMLPARAGHEFYMAAVRGAHHQGLIGKRVPIDQGIAGWVAHHRKPLLLHGEVKDPRFAPVRARPEIQSAISMPLLVGGQLVGVLNANTLRHRRFTLGDIKALTLIANTASSTLEAARLYGEVKQAEEQYRMIFENAAEGIFQSTPEGRFITVNPAMVRMLGYESSTEMMASITSIDHQLYVDPTQGRRYRQLLEADGVVQGFEMQLYRKDKSVIWVSINTRAVREASGALRYYEGTAEDITARKHVEELLETRVRQQAALADLGQRALAYTDLSQLMDDAVRLITQTLEMEYCGVLELLPNLSMVLRAGVGWEQGTVGHATVGAGVESLAGYILLAGQPVVVEDLSTETRFRSGSWLHDHGAASGISVIIHGQSRLFGVLEAHTACSRTYSTDEVYFLQAVAQVLATAVERMRTEAALHQTDKLATMGSLLAGVAHELNNPLTVILGQTELLLGLCPQGPIMERIDRLSKAAERCARIVKNFLALARQHPPERQQVQLNQVAREAVELLAYPLRVDNVEIIWDLTDQLPWIWADSHMLYQVVANLIANAQQAMHITPPPRRLTITTRAEVSSGGVILVVADTGPGVPAELQARIFEPFFTTKPPGQGTGLGLSLCQGIIGSHGGTMRVESPQGRGATFIVELPVGTHQTETATLSHAPGMRPPVKRKHILVLDDEPEVVGILAELLSIDNHLVDTATTAAMAMDKLQQRPYDLILSDLRMPETDGATFYRELQRHHPALCQRVIFLTGDSLSPESRTFLEQTVVPTLGKPVTLTELRSAVQQLLDRRGE
jgi:PAS domain S-box-containing protein